MDNGCTTSGEKNDGWDYVNYGAGGSQNICREWDWLT
jgi:hypothetical protein